MESEDQRLAEVRDTLRLVEQARESARLCGDLEIVPSDEQPTLELVQRLRELEAAPIMPLSERRPDWDVVHLEHDGTAPTTEHR